jgi:hypothetical protein
MNFMVLPRLVKTSVVNKALRSSFSFSKSF